MADNDEQPKIGVADAEDDASKTSEDSPQKRDQEVRVLSIPGSANPGGRTVRISSMSLGGRSFVPQKSKWIPVIKGQELIFFGSGLAVYDAAQFITEDGRVFATVRKMSGPKDPFFAFTAPDALGSLSEGSFLWLRLVNFNNSRFNVTIAPYLRYGAEEEKGEEKKSKETGGGGEQTPEERARAEAFGKAAMEVFTEAGKQSIRAPLAGTAQGLKMAQGTSGSPKPAPAAQSSGVTSAKSKIQTEEYDADVDVEGSQRISGEAEVGSSVQTTVRVSPETIKQSAEIVGEYIDKRPEIIAHAQTREKVLGALKTGNLGSLSAEEHANLRSAVKTITSAPGGVSAQIQTAANIVNTASSQIIAQAQVQGEAGVEAEAKVSGEMKAAGQAEASAKGQVGVSAEATVSAPSPSITPAGGQSSGGGVAGQSGGGMSIKQSAEVVGEHLDKNPQIIPDSAARGRILNALADGNVENLSPDDKQTLLKAFSLISSGPNVPPRLKEAMGVVGDAAAGMPSAAQSAVAPSQKAEIHPPPAPPLKGGEEAKTEKPSAEPGGGAKGEEFQVPPGARKMIEDLRAKNKPLDLGRAVPPGAPSEPGQAQPGGAQPVGADQRAVAGGGGQPAKKAGEGAPEESLGAGLGKPLPESPAGAGGEPSPASAPEKAEKPESGLPAGQPGEKLPEKSRPLAPSSKPEKPEPLSPEDKQKQADRLKRAQGRALKAAYEGNSLVRKAAAKKGIKSAEQLTGLASSKIWYWALGGYLPSWTLSFVVMDIYWVLHRRNKALFPMPVWMKAVTVICNLLPFLLIIVFVLAVLLAGCKMKIIGADTCESVESINFEAINSLVRGTEPPPSPPGARCSPVMTGSAEPGALSATCFGQNAVAASIIAGMESGGDPGKESRVDKCKDGNPFSIGLYQINLIAHGDKISSACGRDSEGKNKIFRINGSAQGNCLQRNSSGICIQYDCQVIDLPQYQQCVNMLKDPAQNINLACQISGNGSNWSAWAYSKNKCGL